MYTLAESDEYPVRPVPQVFGGGGGGGGGGAPDDPPDHS